MRPEKCIYIVCRMHGSSVRISRIIQSVSYNKHCISKPRPDLIIAVTYTVSSDLRLHIHGNKTVNSVQRSVSPRFSIAQYLPIKMLADIYKMCFHPYFDYCDIIYDVHLRLR